MNLCLHCRRRVRTCLCQELKPFETSSRFLILMHPMEFKKERVGTGRLTHLILKNSRIFVGVNFDQDTEFQRSLSDPDYESSILYPGETALNLSEVDSMAPAPGAQRKQFVIIDGTWPCAKKMMKLSTSLHPLPRVSFSPERRSEFKVKHQPLPGCLSTIESVHQLILELNRLGHEQTSSLEENLMSVFRQSVQQQLQLAADPAQQGYRRKAYSSPENRPISRKWGQRQLFFKAPDLKR